MGRKSRVPYRMDTTSSFIFVHEARFNHRIATCQKSKGIAHALSQGAHREGEYV
jgi:hypothetical protein